MIKKSNINNGILLNDKFRWQKFFFAISILFSMSYYSYFYGKIQPSTIERARASYDKQVSFPYMRVISYEDRLAVMIDQWGTIYKIEWTLDSSVNPGMLFSFKGKLKQRSKTIYNVNEVISHRGSILKMYVSLFALIILCGFFFMRFSIDSNGLYLIHKKETNA